MLKKTASKNTSKDLGGATIRLTGKTLLICVAIVTVVMSTHAHGGGWINTSQPLVRTYGCRAEVTTTHRIDYDLLSKLHGC